MLTAEIIRRDFTAESIEPTPQKHETWAAAAVTYERQAQLVRDGRVWRGDPARAKSTRWLAVLFRRLANLSRGA